MDGTEIFLYLIAGAGLVALLKYLLYDCNFSMVSRDKTEAKKITDLLTNQMKPESTNNDVDTPYVFITLYEDGKELGDIYIYLYETDCPITSKNFKELCSSHNPLFGYKNSIIHRNIPNFMIQGGDFTNHNGTGGKSIYNKNFKDENFKYKNKRGSIAMANAGPDTNGSQFFFNMVDNTHLDDKHVVFGKIIDGLDLLDYINQQPVGENDKPLKEIRIHDCGRIWLEEGEEGQVKLPTVSDVPIVNKEDKDKLLHYLDTNY